MEKVDVKSLTRSQLTEFLVQELGQPKFRAEQI